MAGVAGVAGVASANSVFDLTGRIHTHPKRIPFEEVASANPTPHFNICLSFCIFCGGNMLKHVGIDGECDST